MIYCFSLLVALCIFNLLYCVLCSILLIPIRCNMETFMTTCQMACAILDDSVGICASSSPGVSGGFSPKFSPLQFIHHLQFSLPHLHALPHQPPSSTLATPSVAIRSQQTSTNHEAKLMSFSLRQERVQQNAHQATTLAITVEDCNLSSEECETQRVNALTKDDLAILAKNGWLTDNIINAAQALLSPEAAIPPHKWFSKCNARLYFGLHCAN